VELFGRASWVTLLAGALPTGLAGWWIGTHPGAPASAVVLAAALSLAVSMLLSWLAMRWFVRPLRELERGLERWTRGDLSTSLDESRMAGWRNLGRQFDRAQADLAASLAEAKAGLSLERARLEALVEKLPDALIMTNLRGEVVFLNAPALPLLGAHQRDAESGRRGLLTPREPNRWRARFQELLKAHSGGGMLETQRPDGSPASYKTAVSMFSDPVTGDFGVLMMLRDVTAERRLDALKEEFFQAAAHDLRAPLFAVSGFLRLLRRSFEPDGRQAGWLDQIDQSLERLTQLVKDTLDAARIESGRLRLTPAPVDARALLRRAARLFQPLADERRITLDVRVPDEAPALEGDERLLERLLHNLLSNAVKFTPPEGHVTLEASVSGPGHLELIVSDTGPGIPEAQRTAVFEKFRQLDAAESRAGFGLGLNICAKIVKLHGGVIWVQPAPAGGSQFIARLPLSRRTKEAV
jgi:PAS domain S-box-containing protein